MKNTAWTKGESGSGDFQLWIGLNKVDYVCKHKHRRHRVHNSHNSPYLFPHVQVVYESDEMDGDFRWDSSECSGFELQDENNFCDDCKSSCLAAVTMVISNLITTLPNIKGNISRSTPKGDRNCEKTMALITGFIGTLSTLLALSLYADVCGRQLPDTVAGNSISYELGPGFICLLVATLLKPIDVVINLLMPVPEPEPEGNNNIKKSLLDI